MTNTPILNTLNEAGEALKALGEDDVTLSYRPRSYGGPFCVSIGLGGHEYVHGFADTPAAAYEKAVEKKAAKGTEIAIRARIKEEVEARVRAELQKAA